MEYQLGKHFHKETNTLYPTLLVKEPLAELTVLSYVNDIVELDYTIEWLEDLIKRNIPDSSELGGIRNQSILWGSSISSIVELDKLDELDKNKEFKTVEFLDLCKEWKIFVEKNK